MMRMHEAIGAHLYERAISMARLQTHQQLAIDRVARLRASSAAECGVEAVAVAEDLE